MKGTCFPHEWRSRRGENTILSLPQLLRHEWGKYQLGKKENKIFHRASIREVQFHLLIFRNIKVTINMFKVKMREIYSNTYLVTI